MIRTSRLGLAAALATLTAASLPFAASCALSEMGAEAPPDGSPLPATDAVTPGVDAASDAGEESCDASAADCVSKPLTCDEATFCPVSANVSAFTALVSVWGSGPNDVWAVGSAGTALHWDGVAFTPTTTNTKLTLGAVWAAGPNDVWTAGDTNLILRRTGAAWAVVPPAGENEFSGFPVFAIWGPGNGELHLGTAPVFVNEGDLGGPGSLVAKVAGPDGGIAWRARIGPGSIRGIWGSSADDLWAVGDDGATVHGTRANAKQLHTWVEVDSQSRATLGGVWGSSPSDVWAVGDGGTLRHITAGAPVWEVVPSPTTTTLRKIWGSSAKDIWAVGDAGTILHYDGAGWTSATAAFSPGRKPRLYGVWGSGESDVWIVGDGIVLRTSKKAGGAP